MPVISMTHLVLKVVDEILFPPPPMVSIECDIVKRRVFVSPKFHPLDRAQASDISVRVGSPMGIRPHSIYIKPVDQISSPDVALKLYRSIDGGKLILDLDVFVM